MTSAYFLFFFIFINLIQIYSHWEYFCLGYLGIFLYNLYIILYKKHQYCKNKAFQAQNMTFVKHFG